MSEVLEEIMRAARHHLADPDDPAKRDRLSAAVKEAESALYAQPDDLTPDGIQEPPWPQMEGWDPSWSGTRCPSCGHLHPTTAETVRSLSKTCLVCGAPMRTYTLEDLWAKADAGPRSASVMPLEDMDPFAEKAIQLTPEAWAYFLRVLADPPPIAPALLRAFKRRQALGLAGDEGIAKEVGAMLAVLAIGENECKSGDTSAAKSVFDQIRRRGDAKAEGTDKSHPSDAPE